MSHCPKCGAPTPPDGNFCERCGGRLSGGGGGGEQVVVGSSPDCDVILSSPIISGRHASFQGRPGGRFLVTDLGSTNGVFVNEQRVQISEVGPSDRISLGSMWLDLQAVHAALVRIAEPPRHAQQYAPPPPPPPPRPNPPPAPAPQPDPAPICSPPPPPPPVNIHIGNMESQGRGPAPGRIREPVLVILLGLFTLGLYFLYWFWVTLDEIRVWRQGQGWGGAMILLLFIPILNVIVLAVYFLIPSYIFDLYQRHGIPSPISGPFGFIMFLPALLVPLGIFATVASGGVLGLPVLVLAVLIPTLCTIIWFWRVQSALNGFWRSRLAV